MDPDLFRLVDIGLDEDGKLVYTVDGGRNVHHVIPETDGDSLPEDGSLDDVLATEEITSEVQVTIIAADIAGWVADGSNDPASYAAGDIATGVNFDGKRLVSVACEIVTPFSRADVDRNEFIELKFGETTLGDWATFDPYWYLYVDATEGNSPGTPLMTEDLLPVGIDGDLTIHVAADNSSLVPDAGEVILTFTLTDDPAVTGPSWRSISDLVAALPDATEKAPSSPLVLNADAVPEWRESGVWGSALLQFAVTEDGTYRAVWEPPPGLVVIVEMPIWMPGDINGTASLTVRQTAAPEEPYYDDLDVSDNYLRTLAYKGNLAWIAAYAAGISAGDQNLLGFYGPDGFFGTGEIEAILTVSGGATTGLFSLVILYFVVGETINAEIVP